MGFSDITIKKETIFLNDKQWKNDNQRSRFCFEVEKRSKRWHEVRRKVTFRRMNRRRELCEVAQWKRGLSVPLLKDGIGVRWPNLGTWDLNGILRRRGHLRAPPRTTSFVFPLYQFWPFLFHSRPNRIYLFDPTMQDLTRDVRVW